MENFKSLINFENLVKRAKEILPFFEREFPQDKRPRKAIEAAVRCWKMSSGENVILANKAATHSLSAERIRSEFASYYWPVIDTVNYIPSMTFRLAYATRCYAIGLTELSYGNLCRAITDYKNFCRDRYHYKLWKD
jgi:hypothetical protein